MIRNNSPGTSDVTVLLNANNRDIVLYKEVVDWLLQSIALYFIVSFSDQGYNCFY